MALCYDDQLDRYVGERLSVGAAAFAAAFDELFEDGMNAEQAHQMLLQEEEWSLDMDGVELRERKQWLPTLWYDARQHRYVGPRLSVAFAAFEEAVRLLKRAGVDVRMAYEQLRQEAAWSLGMPGVQPVLIEEEIVAAAEQFLRTARA